MLNFGSVVFSYNCLALFLTLSTAYKMDSTRSNKTLVSLKESIMSQKESKKGLYEDRNILIKKDIITFKDDIESLQPLEVHNLALKLLIYGKKEQAVLILKKNIYQNFFLPSYFVLSTLKVSLSLSVFIVPFGLSLLALLFCVLLLTRQNEKILSVYVILCLLCVISYIFLSKKRMSSFQELALYSAPYINSPILEFISPNMELMVIKEVEGWMAVKNSKGQKAWVRSDKVLDIF